MEGEYKIDCLEFSVIKSILQAVKQISIKLRNSEVSALETHNKFGDKQLIQDVMTDQLVEKYLRANDLVKGFASQERPEYISTGEGSGYVVTLDPMDGSSIIDTNFAVGSIFSIWPTGQNRLIGNKLSSQVNAVLATYGPRTTAILYNSEVNKVQELTLIQGKWVVSHDNLKIKEKTKMFCPGNLRASTQHEEYRQIVQSWMQKQYILRYTGGLVPDICQIFIKGHGIFANVSSKSYKSKLRVLFQVAAVGFLIHKAGGHTVTNGKISLLDYQIKTYDDKLSFAAGSKEEVDILAKVF